MQHLLAALQFMKMFQHLRQKAQQIQSVAIMASFTAEEREHVLVRFVRKTTFLVDTPEDYRRVKTEMERREIYYA